MYFDGLVLDQHEVVESRKQISFGHLFIYIAFLHNAPGHLSFIKYDA